MRASSPAERSFASLMTSISALILCLSVLSSFIFSNQLLCFSGDRNACCLLGSPNISCISLSRSATPSSAASSPLTSLECFLYASSTSLRYASISFCLSTSLSTMRAIFDFSSDSSVASSACGFGLILTSGKEVYVSISANSSEISMSSPSRLISKSCNCVM